MDCEDSPVLGYKSDSDMCLSAENKHMSVQSVQDVNVQDVNVQDVNVQDVNVQDVNVQDVNVQDVNVQDVNVQDVNVQDVNVQDVNVQDVNVQDVNVQDVNVQDVNVQDVNVQDVNVQDMNVQLEQFNCSSSAKSLGETKSLQLRDLQEEWKEAVVINLEDHTEISDSLIFLLRLQTSSRDLFEVEFEFNLTTDNALTLIDELKDDADIASLSIPPDVMLSAIRPIVELAKQVAVDIKKNPSTSTEKGLSSAILKALLGRIGIIKACSSVKFSNCFEISDNLSEIANEMQTSTKNLMGLITVACRRFNYKIAPVRSATNPQYTATKYPETATIYINSNY